MSIFWRFQDFRNCSIGFEGDLGCFKECLNDWEMTYQLVEDSGSLKRFEMMVCGHHGKMLCLCYQCLCVYMGLRCCFF